MPNTREHLFDQAPTCLHTIPRTGAPIREWLFGGGTVMMLS